MERDASNTALLWILVCVAIVALGRLIVASVRYYRRNNPRRMAIRVKEKPCKDATLYIKPGSL